MRERSAGTRSGSRCCWRVGSSRPACRWFESEHGPRAELGLSQRQLQLKNVLLPPLDRVSALLDDLGSSGLLADTLVVVMGEFGRTPKVNNEDGGRDHWAACFGGLFAGAGVRGGQVIGRSDASAAFPATPYSPDDVGATVYDVLGLDPTSEVRDRLDRPVQLNRGEVIRPLVTGAATESQLSEPGA
ncbi:MAG: DUF1501 domain-containing protein [Gemmataceae bacterium]